jgi:ABC-2 type transport system ATP-binding protein
VEIRELLVELARMGKTVFFSTHILADVAEICTRVGIIEEGCLVALGSLEELHLQSLSARRVEVALLGEADLARTLLADRPEVSALETLSQPADNGRVRLAFEFNGDDPALSRLLADLVAAGLPVVGFNADQPDLEEVFLRLTKGVVS